MISAPTRCLIVDLRVYTCFYEPMLTDISVVKSLILWYWWLFFYLNYWLCFHWWLHWVWIQVTVLLSLSSPFICCQPIYVMKITISLLTANRNLCRCGRERYWRWWTNKYLNGLFGIDWLIAIFLSVLLECLLGKQNFCKYFILSNQLNLVAWEWLILILVFGEYCHVLLSLCWNFRNLSIYICIISIKRMLFLSGIGKWANGMW